MKQRKFAFTNKTKFNKVSLKFVLNLLNPFPQGFTQLKS